MLKKLLLLLPLLMVLTLTAAKPPRITQVSGKVSKITRLEIVTPKKIPVVNIAAAELQSMLSTATGTKIPIAAKPTPGKFSIILGDNPLLKKAGLDVRKLPEEGYYMVRRGNHLYLAGRDTPTQDSIKHVYIFHKRGTLSAAYDFLERFGGVKFYFPGKYGTVIKKQKALLLPEKIYIVERPDRAMRSVYCGPGCRWYDSGTSFRNGWNLQQLRLRNSESAYPFCHGLNRLNYVKRFGRTKPEFFALMTDGRRYIEGDRPGFSGQYCFSSGVRDQIFQDAKRYFEGASPQSVVGYSYWSEALVFGKNFCVMPQDWLYWCNCEKCRKIAPGGRTAAYTKKYKQAISDFMWSFTAEIANRLTKAGIDCNVSQMAYAPYDAVPNIKLPSNILVQVAVNGRGGSSPIDKNDIKKMKAWSEKLGHPVMIWTYAQGKHMSKNIPGVPPMMPRHLGTFIDRSAPYFDGGFFEGETDFYLFSYLNNYLIYRKLWDSSLDTGKLLDEHYSLMFGKGAPMMKKFYEALEDIWANRIIGNVEMTPIGPVNKVPSTYDIWTKLYSPARIKEFHGLFNAARRAAAADKEAVGRIEFIRANLLGPIENTLKAWLNAQQALDFWKLPLNTKGYLRPLAGTANEVATSVEVRKAGGELIFDFNCEEPFMKSIKMNAKKNGAKNLWADSCIELLINPSGDRKNYCQIITNAAGFVTMYKFQNGKGRIVPAPMIKASAVRGSDSWRLTVKMPLSFSGLDKKNAVPVNFGRHRALNNKPVKHIYYHWNPIRKPEKGFHDLRIWGLLTAKDTDANLVRNGDFAQEKKDWHIWLKGGPKGGSACSFDRSLFIAGGRALHLKNKQGNSCNAVQILGDRLKPNKKYRLSYFVRTKNLKGTKGGAGAYIHFGKIGSARPRRHVLGTRDWTREVHVFTTPADLGKGGKVSIGLWIWTAGGEAWFDCVRIEEVK